MAGNKRGSKAKYQPRDTSGRWCRSVPVGDLHEVGTNADKGVMRVLPSKVTTTARKNLVTRAAARLVMATEKKEVKASTIIPNVLSLKLGFSLFGVHLL